jgi:hypothetical protein
MKNIKAILAQLSRELQRAEDVDVEAREILKELHEEIDEPEKPDSLKVESMIDRVKALETRFATRHPALERIASELADALAKMGI